MDHPDEVDPNLLLEHAASWGLRSALVVGWAKDGSFVWGSSEGSAAELVFMLESAKNDILTKCTMPDPSERRH